MNELKQRMKSLFEEIGSIYVRNRLRANLTAAGIDQSEAHNWTIEIGEVVNEYEKSLRLLIDLIQESDLERVTLKFESWLAYTKDISLFRIGDIAEHTLNNLQKYLPPEPEDDEEDEA